MYITTTFLIVACIKIVEVTERKDYYRAAIFEQVRFGNYSHTKTEILSKNLGMYERAARTAAKNGADIIVYPEWGLYPNPMKIRKWSLMFAEDIPDPQRTYSNPCEQNENNLPKSRTIITKLSCIAKENRIYLVANTADSKKCSNNFYCDANEIESCSAEADDCPDDGVHLYNTNIVFNREGTLIAKYYKKHLYFEFDMDNREDSDDVIFDTDFGRFTTFICFDLIFKDTVKFIESSGVRNVVFSTHWFDHLPLMYFATSYHQSWAISHGVNLISANSHVPGTGSLGSGIYSGSQGALVYTDTPDGWSKLLISNVPTVPNEHMTQHFNANTKRFNIDEHRIIELKGIEQGDFKRSDCETNDLSLPEDLMSDYRCNSMNTSDYKFLKLEKEKGILHSCGHNICCKLTYAARNMNEDYFLAIASNKLIFRDKWSFGTEGCFLTRCDSMGSETCKKYVLKSNTVFEFVKIKANISATYVYPHALNSDVRLTDKNLWHFNGKNVISYKNADSPSSLLLFGIYGRQYEQDEVLD